jgi:tRNA-dihydrouridine synthase B
VRIARKHLGWYAAGLCGGEEFRHEVNTLETSAAQIAAVNRLFDRLAVHAARLETPSPAYVAAPWGEEALAA